MFVAGQAWSDEGVRAGEVGAQSTSSCTLAVLYARHLVSGGSKDALCEHAARARIFAV